MSNLQTDVGLWAALEDIWWGLKKVRYLKLKMEKESGLKDNLQMHYKGLGQVEAKTTWSKNGSKTTIPDLQDRLFEIIQLTK